MPDHGLSKLPETEGGDGSGALALETDLDRVTEVLHRLVEHERNLFKRLHDTEQRQEPEPQGFGRFFQEAAGTASDVSYFYLQLQVDF